MESDFKCIKCGNETYVSAENDYEKVIICEKCADITVSEYKKERPVLNIPKCPTCQSTNISKIGSMERVGSIATLGLFSKKINKSFKCKACGYTW